MDKELENNLETTEPILGPDLHPQVRYHPMATRGQYHISHRDFYVLSLHLAGYTAEEISELTDRSVPWIYSILKKKEVVLVRQQLLEGLEGEFEALQRTVIKVVKEKLDSKDERVQLEAVNIWMRAHGKYLTKPPGSETSAEDVVKQILNQVNVQVNVNK